MLQIAHILRNSIVFLIVITLHGILCSISSADIPGSFYSIHVSSHRYRNNAESEVFHLKKRGLQAFHQYETIPDKGKWYRVYIGRFDTKKEAKQKAIQLKQQKIVSYYSIIAIQEIREASPRHTIESDKYLQTETGSRKVSAEPHKEEPLSIKARKKQEEMKTDKLPLERRVEVKADKEKAQRAFERTKAERRKVSPVEKTPTETILKQWDLQRDRFLSMYLKAGAFTSSTASDFEIIEDQASGTMTWSFTGDTAQAGIVSSIKVFKGFNMYGGFEYAFADEINAMFFSVGPELTFDVSDSIFPYIKGGTVYGTLDWEVIPGEFDDGLGWETGCGVYLLKSRFKLGVDFLYRGIEFDYTPPNTTGVSANDSLIDVSGFSISGSVAYFF